MRLDIPIALLISTTLFLGHDAHAQTVWTVDDDGGGSQFTDIQDAIDVASNGDLILVRAGGYNPVTIDGKGLTIIAPANELVQVDGAVAIRNIDATQRVLVRNIDFTHSVLSGTVFAGYKGRNAIFECDGPVWLEDCLFRGGTAHNPADNKFSEGLAVNRCAAVTLQRCELIGGQRDPGHGLLATDSQITAHGCRFTSDSSLPGSAGVGSDAIHVVAGAVVLSGCLAQGSHGAPGGDPLHQEDDGGDGGNGLFVTGGGSVFTLDSTFLGGAAGEASGIGADGAPGQGIVVDSGQVTPWAGATRTVRIESPVLGPSNVQLVVAAEPGDAVIALVSLDLAPTILPQYAGALLLAAPSVVVPLGVAGPSGDLSINIPDVPLGGAPFLTAFLQGAFVDPTGKAWLGSGSMYVKLP